MDYAAPQKIVDLRQESTRADNGVGMSAHSTPPDRESYLAGLE